MARPRPILAKDTLVKEDVFLTLARHLHESVGIHLSDSEKSRVLLSTRMTKVLARRGLASLEEFQAVLARGDAQAHADFVNALTTNTTHFWREPKHFDHLRAALPGLARERRGQGARELRLWCAASSTGEEPYALAMILDSLAREGALSGLPARVLATDIDTNVLVRAAAGVYPAESIEALPLEFQGCFARGRGESAARVRVASRVRGIVTFAQFNLKATSYTFARPFDVVFCRNVLIYFTREDIAGVAHRMETVLVPGGLLYLGHSETLMGIPTRLRSLQPAVYTFEPYRLPKEKVA